MTARDDAIIEAGARALADATGTGAPWADETWGDEAAAVIAAVAPLIRADERGWIARANADSIEAEVRERIAQEISDAWDAAKEKWRSSGDAYWEGRMDALDLAERIARGES